MALDLIFKTVFDPIDPKLSLHKNQASRVMNQLRDACQRCAENDLNHSSGELNCIKLGKTKHGSQRWTAEIQDT